MNKRWIGILCGLGAAAIWGGMYVVSKLVLDVIPPFTLVSLRLLLGTAALWAVVRHQGGLGFSRRQIGLAMAVGWVGYGVSLSFQFIGTRLSTASNGALVTSATPAFVLLFAAWLLGERITRRKLAALGLSSLGVLVVIDIRSAQLSADLFWGNLSLAAAALTWALYSVLVRKVTQDLEVVRATMVFFWGGMLVALPASAFELNRASVGAITPAVVLGVLYLGLISTALAMYLWNRAFATLEAGTASLTFFAQPLVGVSLGALLLGEPLSLSFVLGAVLIGVGLWLAAT